jgi:hypothetical protein
MGELFPGSSCLPGHKLCSTSADAAADSRQTTASRFLQFQFAFAIRGVRQASTDILIRQIGKFAQDIPMTHPARQVFQHIIDRDAKSSDAWLPSALSCLQSDDLGVVHRLIIAGLTRAFGLGQEFPQALQEFACLSFRGEVSVVDGTCRWAARTSFPLA